MSDFEDKLNKLLNDPKEMERFAGFAKSLMSGDGGKDTAAVQDTDADIMKSFGTLLKSGSGGSRGTKLLEAMQPFLSEKRRGKIDRAMKIARLAGIAELAASQLGGDDDGGI